MKSAASSLPVEKLFPSEQRVDADIAEQVGQEIIQNRLEPAAWATALAASGGKRQDALACYARIRMREISARRRQRHAKVRSFEARRLTTCLGIRTVQDLLSRSNRGGQLNLAKPRLSMIWLTILMLGCAGSAACIGRLLGEHVPDRLEYWVPGIAIVCGTLMVGIVLVMRAFLPKRWVMLGWNTGLGLACSMACFGSLMLGAKLIARTPPEIIQKIAARIQLSPLPVEPVKKRTMPDTSSIAAMPIPGSTAAVEMEAGEE